MDHHLLSIITFMPSFAALILAVFLRGDDAAAGRNAKWLALITTTVTFLISLFILFDFDPSNTGFQFVDEAQWLMGLKYRLGVDGISILFVMLTTFMMPLVIAASWNVETRVKEYMIAFLLLETLMLGVFMALDLVLFYLFFEAGLIPMFLIIGIWGGANRIYASFKFFLYTFLGSVLMLVAMVMMYADAGTTCIGGCEVSLLTHTFASDSFSIAGITVVGGLQTMMFLAFFASFAVKMPMWPVHTWLPDAHVEAPTGGSVVLAAIMLKLGAYGFLRFSLPIVPDAAMTYAPFIITISLVAVIYIGLVALVQKDMKRLVAYSILSQLSFCTLGIFCFSLTGLDGAVYQIINEGVSGGALLVLLGILYERYGTFEIAQYGGLSKRLPHMATLYVITTLSLIGLPILNGFVGEFMVLSGSFPGHHGWVVIATLGVILSASYMLWMIQRVFYGPESALVQGRATFDVTGRELITVWPMILLMVVMGVASPYWIKAIDGGMKPLANVPTMTGSIANAAQAPKGMTR